MKAFWWHLSIPWSPMEIFCYTLYDQELPASRKLVWQCMKVFMNTCHFRHLRLTLWFLLGPVPKPSTTAPLVRSRCCWTNPLHLCSLIGLLWGSAGSRQQLGEEGPLVALSWAVLVGRGCCVGLGRSCPNWNVANWEAALAWNTAGRNVSWGF